MPLDIGVGLMLGILLNRISSLPYPLCLLLGVVAALLPDLDYVWKFIRTKKQPHSSHRDGLHYPLLFIPTVGLLGLLFSPQIGLIFSLGALAHFLHDSVGVGFGVKWLFPFKKNSYLFLFQIKTPANHDMPKKRLYSWSDTERDEMLKKYGYNDWIRFVYFQYNPFGMLEYTILLLGVVLAALSA